MSPLKPRSAVFICKRFSKHRASREETLWLVGFLPPGPLQYELAHVRQDTWITACWFVKIFNSVAGIGCLCSPWKQDSSFGCFDGRSWQSYSMRNQRKASTEVAGHCAANRSIQYPSPLLYLSKVSFDLHFHVFQMSFPELDTDVTVRQQDFLTIDPTLPEFSKVRGLW